MKHFIIACCLLCSTIGHAQVVFRTESTEESIIKMAQQSSKPIFIDFYTSWCKPCKLLEKEAYKDKRVAQLLNGKYHSYKFDAEKGAGKILAAKYKVSLYPTLLVLNSKGVVQKKQEGYFGKENFLDWVSQAYIVAAGEKTDAKTTATVNKNKMDYLASLENKMDAIVNIPASQLVKENNEGIAKAKALHKQILAAPDHQLSKDGMILSSKKLNKMLFIENLRTSEYIQSKEVEIKDLLIQYVYAQSDQKQLKKYLVGFENFLKNSQAKPYEGSYTTLSVGHYKIGNADAAKNYIESAIVRMKAEPIYQIGGKNGMKDVYVNRTFIKKQILAKADFSTLGKVNVD
jgi:thioredoxin 1